MAHRIQLQWAPRHQGVSRNDRLGGPFDAYIPDPLIGWDFHIAADVAADIADAERDVLALQSSDELHGSLEGMARFLLCAESVSSSHIEGLSASARRIARAETELDASSQTRDRVAASILGNICAMERAVLEASDAERFALDGLLELHRLIMTTPDAPNIAGVLRKEQNWIGGSSHNPCSAEFVPPPPDHVAPLLDDLIDYVQGDAHSPLTQAGLAHAQFETIHPFAYGNGRAGRALVHVILRRRGLTRWFVPPVSLVLATWTDDYITGLNRYRHIAEPGSDARSAAASDWLRTFATATRRACIAARRYSEEIDAMSAEWRESCGSIRRGSGIGRLLRALPGAPIVTVRSVETLIGRTRARANDAVNALVDAGVLVQQNIGRQRYRVFEAPRVMELFTALERRLASPNGDTLDATPVRRVPERPE